MHTHSVPPGDYYAKEQQQTNEQLTDTRKRALITSRLRILSILAVIASGYFYSADVTPGWLVPLFILAFFVLVRRHQKLSNEQQRLASRLHIIENELKAIEGIYSQFAPGDEFTDTKHAYSFDLDLFGKGSIFQAINRTITASGYHLFAQWLLHPVQDAADIGRRQEIFKELGAQPEFLLQLRTAGAGSQEKETDKQKLEEWLHAPPGYMNNRLIVLFAILMPMLSIAGLVLSFFTGDMHPVLVLTLLANGIIWAVYQTKIKRTNIQVGHSASFIEKYEGLVHLLAGYDARAESLKSMAEHAQRSAQQIRRFKQLVELFNSRNNGMVGPAMNLLFLYDFYNIIQLERWRKQHKELLLTAMEDILLLDVYTSGATYVFNHPRYTYPVFTDAACQINAHNLRHPLLPGDVAVGNDCSLGKNERLYLLTGANMTGKSTFIRTLGTNVLLAHMGLPVPADEMKLPILRIFTSMRITDSVQEDISYFKAELNRIQHMMHTIAHTETAFLVLLDEPLRGTNSQDKQSGTRAIIQRLLGENVIGIIATHDTGLGDMEDVTSGQVANYHFESRVTDNGLTFDFKLKRGISTSNNATILMQQMGIINGA